MQLPGRHFLPQLLLLKVEGEQEEVHSPEELGDPQEELVDLQVEEVVLVVEEALVVEEVPVVPLVQLMPG